MFQRSSWMFIAVVAFSTATAMAQSGETGSYYRSSHSRGHRTARQVQRSTAPPSENVEAIIEPDAAVPYPSDGSGAPQPASTYSGSNCGSCSTGSCSSSSCSSGCFSGRGGCNTGCCYRKCCCRSSVYGGAELVYVKVYQQGDDAFDVINNGNTQNNVAPFDADYEITPRMWVGWKDGCGLGVRATYWEYDHLVDVQSANIAAGTFGQAGATPVSQVVFNNVFAFTPPGPASITAQYDLEVKVWDLDVTQDFCVCGTNVTIAGGVRHVHYRSNYSGLAFPAPNQAGVPFGVFMNHSFNGWGPTFAIEGKRSLGWGGLDFYAGTRQSVLFGQSHEALALSANAGSNISAATRQEPLAISEVRIGLEWSRYVNCTSRVYSRLGWEGQYWHAAGTANNGALDLGFQGFSLAAGVEY